MNKILQSLGLCGSIEAEIGKEKVLGCVKLRGKINRRYDWVSRNYEKIV